MKWENSNVELLKILADPRRSRILQLASKKPVTVKMMAEQMDEDPLRLYYHVKKMVKAELLELKETRQQGNLSEHYYQTAEYLDNVAFRGNVEENAEYLETVVSLVHRRLDPGLRMFRKGLEKVREENQGGVRFERSPYHVMIDSATSWETGREWQHTLNRILQAINGSEEPLEPRVPDDGREDEEGTYQYVIVSYRIEDAEKLGLLDPSEEEPDSE